MNEQSHAMSKPMTETVAVARGFDEAARRLIDFPARCARLCRRNTSALCTQHGVINCRHFVGRIANRDGARHIRTIPMDDTAEVHGDKIALCNGIVPRYAVRLG